ncbi:DinB family protein [Bacillus sp. FJAT-49732]|uniref:DinB family protein n=1 Tax=Lederbergia citrisecunda TaxID=2833583 RepID=A0A942YL62_9BACI|nr:DinB family protein [Lederbergia citrisecunda]MBS4200029.1 DinB family protein [Lederbergia citrisecunda]
MVTLKQFQFARTYTIRAMNQINPDKWDIIPNGYSNSIRWNIGHIYVTAEILLNKADQQYEVKNPEWVTFFAPGTRPSKWSSPPPSAEELIEALKKQSRYIDEFFAGKLDNIADESFEIAPHTMDTVEALLQFVIWHEGVHAGNIKAIGNAVS